jgi:hypothetical protein
MERMIFPARYYLPDPPPDGYGAFLQGLLDQARVVENLREGGTKTELVEALRATLSTGLAPAQPYTGYSDGEPWRRDSRVTLRLETREVSLLATFGGAQPTPDGPDPVGPFGPAAGIARAAIAGLVVLTLPASNPLRETLAGHAVAQFGLALRAGPTPQPARSSSAEARAR